MMCLIAFAWKADPQHPLLLIANRDEFQDRPAAPLGFWADAPDLCAGRDLREGGTWLGVHRRGRLAAVTNVREPHDVRKYARSRGRLATDFLQGSLPAAEHAQALMADTPLYGGFNLLLWDGVQLVYASNRPQPQYRVVEPGVHGLSNAQLDSRWPKVELATTALRNWMRAPDSQAAALFAAMGDRRVPPDAQLPDTGVGLEAERLLAPPFIHRAGYGTRCTTWVAVDAQGGLRLHERRYDAGGAVSGDSSESFRILRPAAARHRPE